MTPVEPPPQEDTEDEGIVLDEYSYPEIEVEVEEEHRVEPLQTGVPEMENEDKTNKGTNCNIVMHMMFQQGTVQEFITCCPLIEHPLIMAERFALVCEMCSDQLSDEKRMCPLGTCGDNTHIKVKAM